MARFTEQALEELAIEKLESIGYHYLNTEEIAPGGSTPARESFQQVLLQPQLEQAVARLNPTIPPTAQQDAVKQLLRADSPELINNNQTFHQMLTEGIFNVFLI